jgi:cell division transport system permease protein
MLWVNIKRILRSGITSFVRNSFVSLAAILVMTMTLFIIGSLMLLSSLVDTFITYVKDKVDVNVYFVTEAPEADILALKTELETLPEVAFVEYLSREDVLAQFRARHEDDQLTLQALDELGENPLGATLSVKARETSQYEGIAGFLAGRTSLPDGAAFIDKVNYAENRAVIDQLSGIIAYVERLGLFIIVIFSVASVLITFNTIRLAIYTAREEISVMRLVGASNPYIRGPFVFEGTLYGVVSGLITLALFYPITLSLREATSAFFNADIFAYYVSNFWLLFLVLVGCGALLGALSSYLAVRKYLSV